eukprot:scaffold67981_cov18-Prasinocladus_malaysianus.AAC.1
MEGNRGIMAWPRCPKRAQCTIKYAENTLAACVGLKGWMKGRAEPGCRNPPLCLPGGADRLGEPHAPLCAGRARQLAVQAAGGPLASGPGVPAGHQMRHPGSPQHPSQTRRNICPLDWPQFI